MAALSLYNNLMQSLKKKQVSKSTKILRSIVNSLVTFGFPRRVLSFLPSSPRRRDARQKEEEPVRREGWLIIPVSRSDSTSG